jgi:hypothetical protein
VYADTANRSTEAGFVSVAAQTSGLNSSPPATSPNAPTGDVEGSPPQRKEPVGTHDLPQPSNHNPSPFASPPHMPPLKPSLPWHQRHGSAEAVLSEGASFGAYTVQSPGGTPPSFSRNRSSSNLAAHDGLHRASRSWDASTTEALDVPSIWEKFGVGNGEHSEDHFHIHLHTSFDSLSGSPRHSSTNVPTAGTAADATAQRDAAGNAAHGSPHHTGGQSNNDHSGRSAAGQQEGEGRSDHAPACPIPLPPSVHDALEDSRRKRSELLKMCQQRGVRG